MDSCVIDVAAWASGPALLLSLWVAYKLRNDWSQHKNPWGFVLLGFWALVPPIWFFVEVEFFRDATIKAAFEGHTFGFDRMKHMQDLARNVWIALVLVLSVILDVKWPK